MVTVKLIIIPRQYFANAVFLCNIANEIQNAPSLLSFGGTFFQDIYAAL